MSDVTAAAATTMLLQWTLWAAIAIVTIVLLSILFRRLKQQVELLRKIEENTRPRGESVEPIER